MLSTLLAYPSIIYATGNSNTEPKVHAEAYILMDAKTKEVLAEKNAYQTRFPASVTKVATAAYALKKESQLDYIIVAQRKDLGSILPEKKVKAKYSFPSYWIEFASSHIGLKVGEKVPFRDLYYGMMLESGNDAANVIASFVSGSVPKFMDELNEYLKEIGCQNTNFNNPHGLHHPEHTTTAYDLALMAREGLKNPFFRQVVSTLKHEKEASNKQKATKFFQSNRLLKKGSYHYSKAIGVKTGYTTKARHTFIAAAEDNGKTLICVLLKNKKAKFNYEDAIRLFDYGFQEKKEWMTVFRQGKQDKIALHLSDLDKKVSVLLKDNVKIHTYPSYEQNIKAIVNWHSLSLPITKGTVIGDLIIKDINQETLASAPILANESVYPTFKQRVANINFWAEANQSLIFSLMFMCVLFSLKARIASKYY